MLASKGAAPSDTELLAVVRGADARAAQAAFQALWRRHEASVTELVRATAQHDVVMPVKRRAAFGVLWAKWPHKSKS